MSNNPDLGWGTTEYAPFEIDAAGVAAQDAGAMGFLGEAGGLMTALGPLATGVTAAAAGGLLIGGAYIAGSHLADEWGHGTTTHPGMIAGDPNGWWMNVNQQWFNAASDNPLQGHPFPTGSASTAQPASQLPAPGSQAPAPPPPGSLPTPGSQAPNAMAPSHSGAS